MARKNKSTNLNMNQLDSVLRNTKSSVDKNDTMKWGLRTLLSHTLCWLSQICH